MVSYNRPFCQTGRRADTAGGSLAVELGRLSTLHLSTFQTKYIFALELNETEITAFYQTGVETKFNNEDALALSLASNVLLAITMDRRSNVTPHLEMTTHPFSRLRNLGEMEKLMKEENFGLIQAALCGGAFPFGLAILATMFIIPLLEEKICNVGWISFYIYELIYNSSLQCDGVKCDAPI